jgi:hypothetical protein
MAPPRCSCSARARSHPLLRLRPPRRCREASRLLPGSRVDPRSSTPRRCTATTTTPRRPLLQRARSWCTESSNAVTANQLRAGALSHEHVGNVAAAPRNSTSSSSPRPQTSQAAGEHATRTSSFSRPLSLPARPSSRSLHGTAPPAVAAATNLQPHWQGSHLAMALTHVRSHRHGHAGHPSWSWAVEAPRPEST